MKKLLLILLCLPMIGFGQSWNYSSGGNDFDGKYKVSSIVGTGNDYPYKTPRLVINYFEKSNQINFYIDDAGYFSSNSNTRVQLVFNDEKGTIHECDVSLSKDNKSIFLTDFNYTDRLVIFKKLMGASSLSIRVSNDFGQNDMKFSLRGSTKAIKYVISDFDEQFSKYMEEITASNEKMIQENIAKEEALAKKLKLELRYDSILTQIDSKFLFTENELKVFNQAVIEFLIYEEVDAKVISAVRLEIGVDCRKSVDIDFNEFSKCFDDNIVHRKNIELYIDYINIYDNKITISTAKSHWNFDAVKTSLSFIVNSNSIPIRLKVTDVKSMSKRNVKFSLLLDSDMRKKGVTEDGQKLNYFVFQSDISEKNIIICHEEFDLYNKSWEIDYRRKNKTALKYNKGTLDYYSNKYYQSTLKDKKNRDVIFETIIYNGSEFRRLKYKVFDKGIGKELIHNMYFLKGKSYFYKIITYTSLDRESEFSPILEEIVKSFRLEN